MSTDLQTNRIPLCKDCKFFVKSDTRDPRHSMCSCPAAPSNQEIIPVTGKLCIEAFCIVERSRDACCGLSGRWFVAREREVEPKGQKFGPFTLIAPEPTPKRPSLLSRLCAVFVKRVP